MRRLFGRGRPRHPRMVVVALDGVPYTYARQLIDQGELPNLAAIDGDGTLAQMDTSVPNVSSVAWASFMTGTNPGKHNIYGFLDRRPGTRDPFIPTSRDLRGRTIYELLGQSGKRVFCMNVPLTYPSRPINGILIGDFLSPNIEKAAPDTETAAALQRLGYVIDADPSRARRDKADFLPHLSEVFERRIEATRHFWKQESWDFFMTHIMETDRLHHFFWEEMETGHPTYAPAFLEFYRRLDSALGEIRGWLDEDTRLIVLSDHGFCSIRQEVHVNTYLASSGYLRYSGERPESLKDVDPSSVAYSLDPGRVYLSVRGREAGGWIAPGSDYDRWRGEVAEALMHMTDPSGKAMVERVDFGEDLYHGQSAANGPDLVLSMRNGYDAKGSFGRPNVCFKGESLVGMHTTPDALLSISGAQELKRRPHIQDLAPTILDMLGVPVPDEMDGHSLVGSGDA